MTKLEKAIMDAARKAQRDYVRITGGWWLMHGPESFLQNLLALEISREKNLGIIIYPECSPKRMKREFYSRGKGRPQKVNEQQRFDVVFWWKNGKPRAILEIKLTNAKADVRKDQKKIFNYANEARKLGISSGYFLVYSEANRNPTIRRSAGKDTIRKRFVRDWGKTPFELIDTFIHEDRESDDGKCWAYGFALYKMNFQP